MIKNHPILPCISELAITEAAERVGYELFIPFTLVRHLASSILYNITDGSPYKCIEDIDAYSKVFHQLIGLIDYDSIVENDVVGNALLLVRRVHTGINLRDFEAAAAMGATATLVDRGKQQNYAIDIASVDTQVLQLLDIQIDEEPNEVVLPGNVLKILGFYEGFITKAGTVSSKYTRKDDNLSTYNQITRIRKYKYCTPQFKADLALKKHSIKKMEIEKEDKQDVVLAVDVNMLSDSDELEFLFKGAILHYLSIFDTTTIHYLEFSRNIIHEVIITSKEQLIQLFHKPLHRFFALDPMSNALASICRKFSNKNVVIITTGTASFYIGDNKANKLHAVSYNDNPTLREICMRTSGSYTLI